jgi:hypothetical protein
MKHKHHIIPKHMGGTDDKSNLIELNVEEHAEAHRILYEEHGKKEDYLAWKGLTGQIDKEDILKEIYKENARRCGKQNIGRTAWNKGLTKSNPKVKGYADKLRKPKTEDHKQALRKPKLDKSNMGKYERTDEIKLRLKEATELQFNEENRKKHSEIIKSNRRKCNYCDMVSNISNIKRHEKKCPKNF